jgi:hypothetical protein
MLTGIVRVLMTSEAKNRQSKNKLSNLSTRLKWNLPPYVKALFLLYLSFTSYYISSESYAIAILLHIPDYMTNLKLEFLTGSFFIGAFYAFWIYQPVPKESFLIKKIRYRFKTSVKNKKKVN